VLVNSLLPADANLRSCCMQVEGDYVDSGFVGARPGTQVPALPFLIGVVVAVLGTAVYVVTATQ
jgi:hypothetical protein